MQFNALVIVLPPYTRRYLGSHRRSDLQRWNWVITGPVPPPQVNLPGQRLDSKRCDEWIFALQMRTAPIPRPVRWNIIQQLLARCRW